MLWKLYGGQNHLFRHFNIFFCHKWENSRKIQEKCEKGVYQHLGANTES